jgi:hypothetical protein
MLFSREDFDKIKSGQKTQFARLWFSGPRALAKTLYTARVSTRGDSETIPIFITEIRLVYLWDITQEDVIKQGYEFRPWEFCEEFVQGFKDRLFIRGPPKDINYKNVQKFFYEWDNLIELKDKKGEYEPWDGDLFLVDFVAIPNKIRQNKKMVRKWIFKTLHPGQLQLDNFIKVRME